MSETPMGPAWAGERPLILASRSSVRRDLLSRCGIEAELVPADLDERAIEAVASARGALPVPVARCLASAKATTVSCRRPRHFVLGADQVLAVQDRGFAKATDRQEAAARLACLAGGEHQLISAGAIARDGVVLYETIEIAELRMRRLSAGEIRAYLDIVGDDVLLSVGGYRIEGMGRVLFDRIRGDHAAILGLPLSGLIRYFREGGLLRL